MYNRQEIAIDRIDPGLERLRRPVPAEIQRMAASLKEKGQLTPVVVTQNDPQFTLVDGFKRYRAAIQLGLLQIKGLVLPMESPRAKAMIYLLNRSGGFSLIQECLLIRELVDNDGLSQSESAILLERHKSWVSRRLSIVRRLAPEIVDDLSLKLIDPGSAASLARLPACNQIDFSAAIIRERLTAKEIAQLTDMFVKADDPGVRRHILKAPRDVLDELANKKKPASDPDSIIRRLGAAIKSLENALKPDLSPSIIAGLRQMRSGLTQIEQNMGGKNHASIEPSKN